MTKTEQANKPAASAKGGFLNFLWNKENKTVLGRTGTSWAKVTLFYICFFSGLGLFFWANIEIFFLTMDKVVPKYFGMESQTLDNPGIAYRPLVNVDSSLIKFYQGEVASFETYVNQLDSFLYEYSQTAATATNAINCDNLPNGKVPQGKVCNFNPVFPNCSRSNLFGFQQGQPCVALKMNRLYNFMPDPYNSTEELIKDQAPGSHIPRFLSFAPGNVGIGCDGENEVDRENLKRAQFIPDSGLSSVFYPYTNQPNYVSPFVFLRVLEAERRVAIMMECKLYAKNIANPGGNEMHGSIGFVLVID